MYPSGSPSLFTLIKVGAILIIVDAALRLVLVALFGSIAFSAGIKAPHKEEPEGHKELMYTGFSVGAVEAFEEKLNENDSSDAMIRTMDTITMSDPTIKPPPTMKESNASKSTYIE